jgi:hypothetical protein
MCLLFCVLLWFSFGFQFVDSDEIYSIVIAGTGNTNNLYNGENMVATSASINFYDGIGSVYVANNGNLFIVDGGNRRIRELNSSNNILTTVAGTGYYSDFGTSGPATSVSFGYLYYITADPLRNCLYLSDSFFLWKYNLTDNYITELGGLFHSVVTTTVANGTNITTDYYKAGFAGDNGPVSSALFNGIKGIWLSTSGLLYISDMYNHRIRVINMTTDIITTFAGSGPVGENYGSFSGDGGPATLATFRYPYNVYSDTVGNVFIADYGNNRVRVVNSVEIITTFAGTGSQGYVDNVPAVNATFIDLYDVKGDSIGNIYIADNCKILKVNIAGFLTTVAGTRICQTSTYFSPAAISSLSYIYALWIDSNSDLYFTEYPGYVKKFITVYSPSSEPSTLPSSQPSSKPTINRLRCKDTSYYSLIENACIVCPVHSFSNQPGDMSCSCSSGYYNSSGYGPTLNCTACPLGTISDPLVSGCTLCPIGTFADSSINSCELCPLGTYNAKVGQSGKCPVCPSGRTTPYAGATTLAECVSPLPNFTMGIFSLVLVVVIFGWYIVFGKFHHVSYRRKLETVIPNIEKCKRILYYEEKELEEVRFRKHSVHTAITQIPDLSQHHFNNETKTSPARPLKVILFLFCSIILIFIVVFLNFVFIFYQIFFTSLILFRGLHSRFQLKSILNLLAQGIIDIAGYISVPFEVFYVFVLPFLYFFKGLASLHVDLSSVNVTCSGSQAPIELLINCFILGLLILIIRSEYQVLYNTLLTLMNRSFLVNKLEHYMGRHKNSKDEKHSFYDSTKIFLFGLLVTFIIISNPFQILLRYAMGFVAIDSFRGGNYHLMHPVTRSCDKIPGMLYFDSILGYSSSVFAWWLILPTFYCLSEVVVAKTPVSKTKVLPHSEEAVHSKSYRKLHSHTDSDGKCGEEDEALHKLEDGRSVSPMNNHSHHEVHDEDQLHAFILASLQHQGGNVEEKLASSVKLVAKNYATHMLKQQKLKELEISKRGSIDVSNHALVITEPKKSKKHSKSLFSKMFSICTDYLLLIFSIDVWLSAFLSLWIRTLHQKHETPAEEKKESCEKSETTYEKTTKKKKWWIGGRFSQHKSSQKSCMTDHHTKVQNAMKKVYHLPSYYRLCKLVHEELHHTILDPIANILAFLGIGHFFTSVGLKHWKIVFNNYRIFILASFGIWTNEAVEAYDLVKLTEQLIMLKIIENEKELKPINTIPFSTKSDDFESKKHENLRDGESTLYNAEGQNESTATNEIIIEKDEILLSLMAVTINCRVILFQIVPSLVLLSTFCMSISSCPLLLYNDFLIESLPPFIIYGSKNFHFALRKEVKLMRMRLATLTGASAPMKLNSDVIDPAAVKQLLSIYGWRIIIRQIVVFWNDSRGLQLVQSLLLLLLSVFFLIYDSKYLYVLITILMLLLPFIFSNALLLVLYLGKAFDIRDSDISWLTCGLLYYWKEKKLTNLNKVVSAPVSVAATAAAVTALIHPLPGDDINKEVEKFELVNADDDGYELIESEFLPLKTNEDNVSSIQSLKISSVCSHSSSSAASSHHSLSSASSIN